MATWNSSGRAPAFRALRSNSNCGFASASIVMLVRTRKFGESIRIGAEIEVTVLIVESSGLGGGIGSPPSTTVDRGEAPRRQLAEAGRPAGPRQTLD